MLLGRWARWVELALWRCLRLDLQVPSDRLGRADLRRLVDRWLAKVLFLLW